MKLFVTADLHAHRPWFEFVRAQAADYDGVCIVGDLLLDDSKDTRATQIKWVSSWVKTFPRDYPLFLCSGNHDEEIGGPAGLEDAMWLRSLASKNVCVDGQCRQFGDLKIECVQWGMVPDPLHESAVALVHEPPEGSRTARRKTDGRDVGGFELAEFLRTEASGPLVLLTGHSHSPESWKDKVGGTTILNPGYAATRRGAPNYIQLTVRKGSITASYTPASGQCDICSIRF